MKIEIGKTKPANFTEAWPGELSMSSHFECGAVVPNVLSMITTLKENGKPNACFYAGITFAGGPEHYYVVMPWTGQSHTYFNILRDKEFCVNFISSKYCGACNKTIEHNGDDDDEISVGGFTSEPCKTIKVPRLGEAFISLECKLIETHDIAGLGKEKIFIGEVQLAHVEEGFHQLDKMCSLEGFIFNINSAQNLKSDERMPYAKAYLTPFSE